ncbi:hypothetical protein HanRHA438_Chr10g0461781 [Helianthus annuus]|nr:hypothetical protein HanRHA438_Chr10g0461781 [Helianthus annuus]
MNEAKEKKRLLLLLLLYLKGISISHNRKRWPTLKEKSMPYYDYYILSNSNPNVSHI